MTTWYVRPDASHSATRDGTSYATAWGGWASIVWGGAGVVAGDTVYVCGAHSTGAILDIGAHGATVSSRVTIRGDYVGDSGSITFTTGNFYLNVNRSYTTVQNLTMIAANYSCIGLGGAPLTGVHVRGCMLKGGGNSMVLFLSFNGWSYIDCIIDGNTFLGGAGAVGGSAIQWYATSTGSVTSLSNLQISNNTFIGCSAARATILLKALNTVAAATKMADIVVSGNKFIACGAVMMEIYGPEVYGRNTGIKVYNNIIHNQTLVGIIGGGIVLGGFAQSLTADFGENVIRDNEAYELNGMSGFVNLFYGTYKVFNNYADGINTPTIDGNGVLFDHGCDNCEAFGNEFRNIRGTGTENYYGGGFGILVLDATNCKAYGNLIDGCVTGVAFGNKDAGQSANIFNNTFHNCSQSGVYLTGGAEIINSLVRNNIFTATRSTISAVKNNAATWIGESRNCFHGFGNSSGHTLNATSNTADPQLDENYRPRSAALMRKGTYLGGKDFYGKNFYNLPNIGAVDDVTNDPRYLLTSPKPRKFLSSTV